jgi:hypothetical protein
MSSISFEKNDARFHDEWSPAARRRFANGDADEDRRLAVPADGLFQGEVAVAATLSVLIAPSQWDHPMKRKHPHYLQALCMKCEFHVCAA